MHKYYKVSKIHLWFTVTVIFIYVCNIYYVCNISFYLFIYVSKYIISSLIIPDIYYFGTNSVNNIT